MPAACGLPAVRARQPRQVAGARNLHQHRTACGEGGARRLERDGRQPRHSLVGIARELVPGLVQRCDARGGGAQRRPVGHDLLRPPRPDQHLRLRRPGEAAHQQRGSHSVRAQQQHVADVRVGRAGLRVQVVAVVPDGQQPRPVDRREHRRTRAHHDPGRAPSHRQPPAIPLGRPQLGGERHHASAPPAERRTTRAGRRRRAGRARRAEHRGPPKRWRLRRRRAGLPTTRRAGPATRRGPPGPPPARRGTPARADTAPSPSRDRRWFPRPAPGRRRAQQAPRLPPGRAGAAPRAAGRPPSPRHTGRPPRGTGPRPRPSAPARARPPCPPRRAVPRGRSRRPGPAGSRRPAGRRTAPAPAPRAPPRRRGGRAPGSRRAGPGGRGRRRPRPGRPAGSRPGATPPASGSLASPLLLSGPVRPGRILPAASTAAGRTPP